MSKRFRIIVGIAAILGLTFLFMACGGSGGGSVTYNGSTDPAVADSTTAATLAEYAMGATEAGFPLAQMFVMPPEAAPRGLSAQPLAPYAYMNSVVLPVPGGAVINGADYSPDGTGTATIKGSMTLLMGNDDSAEADTWYVVDAELDGSIVFDDFRVDEGPAVDGKVTVPSATFVFSGKAVYSVSAGDLTGDPGFPVWQMVDMTFTNITLSEGSESWSMGEGDWSMEISTGNWVSLNIHSQTVEYQGETYKIEDTNVYVEFPSAVPASLAAAQPLVVPEQTNISISGITSNYGSFSHSELGVIYFEGSLVEESPPGDLTGGTLNFYDDPDEGAWLFDVYFGYDPTYNGDQGATVYNVYIPGDPFYLEKGYIVDGVWTPDVSAPDIAG